MYGYKNYIGIDRAQGLNDHDDLHRRIYPRGWAAALRPGATHLVALSARGHREIARAQCGSRNPRRLRSAKGVARAPAQRARAMNAAPGNGRAVGERLITKEKAASARGAGGLQ